MKIFSRYICVACGLLSIFSSLDALKVAITTESEIKKTAVQASFQNRFPDEYIEILEFKTDSDIPEQPIGYDVALRGVHNRIANLPENAIDGVDYVVSIENYIEQSQSGAWKDIGLLLVINNATHEELISKTKPTNFSVEYYKLAKKMSDSISHDGLSFTVGKAIAQAHPEITIDPSDWQQESEFGGISRVDLLKESLFKTLHADEITFLNSLLVLYPDFPKPGVLFKDFFPLLSDKEGLRTVIGLLGDYYREKEIDFIVGLESRGFIIGAALAAEIGVGFVPVRKPGKLPGETYQITYQKEYGTDTLVISKTALFPGARVLIVDDLIATGGSAKAAIALVQMAGAVPVEFATLFEVRFLEGRENLGIPSLNLID